MSLDLSLIWRAWPLVAGAVVAFMAIKVATIYGVARLFRVAHPDSLRIALLLAQGGEFAFVLFTTATGVGLLDPETAGMLSAAVIVSMALTPLAPILLKRLLVPERPSMDGIDIADGLTGSVLLIGFGRFGQVASQGLLTRGVDVSIIDRDVEMIQAAARFGFKIYYGDGTRLDVLRAAGAARAKVIAICIDKADAANRIVELIKAEFPLARVLVRSFDRGHSLALAKAGVDYEIRETFESAVSFGEAALLALDVPDDEASDIIANVRRRDEERLRIQRVEGLMGGRHLMTRNTPQPTPLTPVKREAKPLTPETAAIAKAGDDAAEKRD
jgi:glutathione-regulated potassium-efflux system protein KefB